jgi:hypothetical protein
MDIASQVRCIAAGRSYPLDACESGQTAHACCRAPGQAHPDGMNPDLRAELLRWMERDQAGRTILRRLGRSMPRIFPGSRR